MRFYNIPNTARTRKKFLWLPKKICGITRWLEIAEFTEVYENGHWQGKIWTDLLK